MAGFFNALSASLVLMMLMSVGYIMGRLGWMTAREKAFLSKYIINIAVPCNCIVGLLNNLDHDSLAQAALAVVSAMSSVVAALLLSALVATLLKLPRKRWGVFVMMGGLSNSLFIGLPVCTQLFGDACTPQVMLYYLSNTVFLQSVGIMLMVYSGGREDSKVSPLQFVKSLLTKPPVLAVALSVVMLLLGLHLPQPVMKFGQYIGNSVTPMALTYCGFILYEVGLKNLRPLPGIPTALVLRLAVSPLLCMVFLNLFGITGLTRSVFLVEAALPVVSQTPVMAGAYGADEKYAATGACLSTLGSFITIPILMLLIGG